MERACGCQYPPPRRTGRQFPRAAARQYPVAHGPLVPRGARAVSVPGWRPAPRVSTRDLVRRVRLTVRWPVKVRPTPAHAEAVARGRHRRADRARAGCPPRDPARAPRLVRSGRRDMCRCATGRAPWPPAGPRVLPHRARPMPTPPAGGLRRGHNSQARAGWARRAPLFACGEAVYSNCPPPCRRGVSPARGEASHAGRGGGLPACAFRLGRLPGIIFW